MENKTYLVRSLTFSTEMAHAISAGVAGNPYLAVGITLGYVLLGLASIIWALWSQRSTLTVFKESIILYFSCRHGTLKGIQNTHNSLFFVLFMGVLNAITAIILALMLAASACRPALTCVYIFTAWLLLRIFGMLIHLMSTMVTVLFLCYPQKETVLRNYATVWVVISVSFTIYFFFKQDIIIVVGGSIFAVLLVIAVNCIMCTPVSPSAAAGRRPIVLVAMLTFLFVYIPVFVLQCLIQLNSDVYEEQTDEYLTIYVNVLFCTNFQLFMDGLLCFFMLQLPAGQEQQEQEVQRGFENPVIYGVSEIGIS